MFLVVVGMVMISIESLKQIDALKADKEDGNYKIRQKSSFIFPPRLSTIILTDNKTGDGVSHLCTVEIWILENDYEPHLIGIANEMEINMMREKTFCIIIDPNGESIWKTDFINFTCSMEDNYQFYITVYRK